MATKVFFEEDTFPIISQILEANSIKESREDVIKKISNDKPLMGEIIIDVAEKIVLENIQEKDACLFLKEQLNVTEQIAKQVYADIQKKLLPLAKKNDVETQTQEQKSITAQPTRLINKNIVKVEEVRNNKEVDELMKGYNMEKGESEAVQLFRELNADLLATDDRNAINTCSLLNIPTSGSLAFVINFYRKNLISKEEGEEMINQLSVFGRYSIDIINKALNDLREVKK